MDGTFIPDREFNSIDDAIERANELSYIYYGAYFYCFKDGDKYFNTKFPNDKCEYLSFQGKHRKYIS